MVQIASVFIHVIESVQNIWGIWVVISFNKNVCMNMALWPI